MDKNTDDTWEQALRGGADGLHEAGFFKSCLLLVRLNSSLERAHDLW